LECLEISAKQFNISIGSKEIPIQDRYTVIKGKFKKDMVKNLDNQIFSEILENIDLIPLSKFIRNYIERLDTSSNFEMGLSLLKILNEFHNIMKKNIDIISQYSEIIESAISILKFNSLVQKRDDYLKELEIMEEYKRSSDTAAILDLLNKLNKSIEDNKKKLRYIEEDYIQRKNQIDQINETIKNYEINVRDLTSQKKEFFSQINKITREMSGSPSTVKEE